MKIFEDLRSISPILLTLALSRSWAWEAFESLNGLCLPSLLNESLLPVSCSGFCASCARCTNSLSWWYGASELSCM
ncbi:hypothetical protein EDD22DRAFT_876681 [Suillus occidentalis]|nr:hypothetical protein EDD22DRAFT_876681 [Suillus occidentalis]